MPIAFVHLSDIHFGQDAGGRLVIHNDVKERLIDDVSREIAKLTDGRARGIIVTGDVAFAGREEEYRNAGRWLDRVAAAAGCAITDIQVVPGNHDIDRSAISQAAAWMLQEIAAGGEDRLDSFLAQDGDRELLYARFRWYRLFAEAYNCPLDRGGGTASDRTLELAPGRSLRFIGLNSALSCSKRDEKGRLILGARQRVLPTTPGEELVVLCHHPLNWLQDSEDARRYVRNRARVFISGHEHSPSVLVDPVTDPDLMMLSAGAVVPPKADAAYTFTYNVLEFGWESASDALRVAVRPRAWSDELKEFETDAARFGQGSVDYTLGCPNFRRGRGMVEAGSDTVASHSSETLALGALAAEVFANGARTIEGGGETMSDPYPLLLLRFFRDLSGGQRLSVLVKLGALPSDWQEPLTHSMERRALDSLRRSGRLDSLEKAIDEVANEDRRQGDRET